jgi:hypothetical protein
VPHAIISACNPSTWEEDREFKASLGYIVKPYLKLKQKTNKHAKSMEEQK